MYVLGGFSYLSEFYDFQCLVDGADEYLQLLDVASHTMQALCNRT